MIPLCACILKLLVGCKKAGRAPALAARPLGYRLRFGFVVRALAISNRTTAAICFASFDDSTFNSHGKVYSSDPAGLPNGDAEEYRWPNVLTRRGGRYLNGFNRVGIH